MHDRKSHIRIQKSAWKVINADQVATQRAREIVLIVPAEVRTGLVPVPGFKPGGAALAGAYGGFDSHALPPLEPRRGRGLRCGRGRGRKRV